MSTIRLFCIRRIKIFHSNDFFYSSEPQTLGSDIDSLSLYSASLVLDVSSTKILWNGWFPPSESTEKNHRRCILFVRILVFP